MADKPIDTRKPTADIIRIDPFRRKVVDPDNIEVIPYEEPEWACSLWDDDPPERTWLIPGVIPDNRIGMLTGEGGLGKSRLAVQIAACIASGDQDWLPGTGVLTGSKPRSVVYLSYEDEQVEVNRRLADILGDRSVHDVVGQRLKFLSGTHPELGALWQPKESGSQHMSTKGEPTKAAETVKNYCDKVNPALLIIDTMAAAYMLSEIDRSLVTDFFNHWDRWGQERNMAIMLLAHPPKSEHRYSGNSGIRGAIRWMLSVERATLVPAVKGTRDKPPEPEVKWPAIVLDKANYTHEAVDEHNEAVWFFHTDRRRGMKLHGKAKVVTRKEAMRLYENTRPFDYQTPPTESYDDYGD